MAKSNQKNMTSDIMMEDINELKMELEEANKKILDLTMQLHNKNVLIENLQYKQKEIERTYSAAIAKLVLEYYGKEENK